MYAGVFILFYVFDTEMNFEDPKLIYLRTFKMNRK